MWMVDRKTSQNGSRSKIEIKFKRSIIIKLIRIPNETKWKVYRYIHKYVWKDFFIIFFINTIKWRAKINSSSSSYSTSNYLQPLIIRDRRNVVEKFQISSRYRNLVPDTMLTWLFGSVRLKNDLSIDNH